MKLLLLHLSDMHIHSSVNQRKIDKIVESLGIFSPDEIIVIISGDLSYSGGKNEFKSVRAFVGSLLNKLGGKFNKNINCIVVPGNHDMFYSNGKLPSGNVIKKLVQNNAEENYKKELSKLENFFEYASSKGSFIHNKDVDNIIFDYKKNGIKVQINLINTAIFSTSKDDNKESHFLPDEAMSRLLRKDGIDLAISVMHHSSEWFHYNTKEKLETLLYKHSDIIFQGHEHQVGSRHIRNEDNTDLIVSKGGEFSGKFTDKSTYSALMIDFENQNYCEYIYTWDLKANIFIHTENGKRILNDANKVFANNGVFAREFFSDNSGISDSVLEYFTFPNLQNDSGMSEKKIENGDDFLKLLDSYSLINIRGYNRSGKTTLLKGLYNVFIKEGYVPLIFHKDNMQTKLNTLVQNLFKEQYSNEESSYQKFLYLDKSKRIILIDDFEKIEPEGMRKKLLPILSETFGTIIFTSSKSVDIDIKEFAYKEVKSEMLDEEKCCFLSINSFYKEKREVLVERVLKCESNYDEKYFSAISKSIDYMVQHKKYGLFNLSPEFIIQYVKFFLNPGTIERKTQTFNTVFETNINNQIINHSKKDQVEDNISFLEELAFNMHFSLKRSYISSEEIEGIYLNCREDRGLDINVVRFITSMIKANILKETKNDSFYEFSNINYLAYFVARKINKIIERQGSYDIPELQYLLQYIVYGINDNILVFLLYIRNNVQFALNICNKLQEAFADFEELDFEKNNIPFLKKISSKDQRIVSSKQKKAVNKIKDKVEEDSSLQEDEEIRFQSLYDYPSDINNPQERMIQSIKWLEIISKSLVSLFNDFSKTERKELINTVLAIQNKILFYLLKPYNDNFDEVIDDFFSMISDSALKDGLNISSEKEKEKIIKIIHRIFVSVSNSFCLGVYNNFAYITSTQKLIKFIENDNIVRNKNDEVFYLMTLDNAGNSDVFIKKAVEMYESYKDNHLRFLIRLIVNNHIINNRLTYRQIDLISAKIFSNNTSIFKDKSKINLLLSSFSSDES